MIHVDYLDLRGLDRPPVPMVLHALREEPTCALVCPADAIKRGEDGVVRSSALKPRCIACSNCVLACPFGVPKVEVDVELMMKVRHVLRPHFGGGCGRCAPPCAPARRCRTCRPRRSRASGASSRRTCSASGAQEVRTKVAIMLPDGAPALSMNAADYTWEKESDVEEAFVE